MGKGEERGVKNTNSGEGWRVMCLYRFPNSFKEKDAFVGYQKDTPAAVVFQASNQLHQYVQARAHSSYLWVEAWERGLLGVTSLNELGYTKEDSEQWKQAVSSYVCMYVYSKRCLQDSISCDQLEVTAQCLCILT